MFKPKTLTAREPRRIRRRGRKQVAGPLNTTFWRDLPAEPAATTIWDREWERSIWEECLRRARREFEADTFRAFELALQSDLPAAEAEWVAIDAPVEVAFAPLQDAEGGRIALPQFRPLGGADVGR